ncbi:hypothetical protein G7054_g7049 [Neopestalotiopsis clavispora]|nr:hypothetical protein G7054_g7049 [Neopestalotiopsis clavispora]
MASETVTSQPAATVQWEDFDDERVFKETEKHATSEECNNFVLEFGANGAQVVRDLSKDQFEVLLSEQQRDGDHPIRWINIWDTSASKDVVEVIGQKYAFSERLISLMMNDKAMQQRAKQQGRKRKNAASSNRNQSNMSSRRQRTTVTSQQTDPEKGMNDDSSTTTPVVPDKSTAKPPDEELELFYLLKNTVNYFSIDHTDRALCIGDHWLYQRPDTKTLRSDINENFLPPKHWLWLVLCDDHTVITLNESPDLEDAPKGREGEQEDWKQELLKKMRANSLDVLIQQSIHGMKRYEQRPLSQNSIRQAWSKTKARSGKPSLSRINSDVGPVESSPDTTLEDDATSSLFYYLFEDYSAAGPLKEAGRILEDLGPKVLGSAERKSRVRSRDIIKPLHLLSKDLRTLKHLFENYMTVIGKILAATRRPGTAPSLDHMHTSILVKSDSNLSESMLLETNPERKVFLTASALQRFDRLKDRLKGYFNLTQQKDSTATARLTRSATLLAKLSVFFLPVGFITAFFSIQIEDMYIWWTASTYWITFGITIGVSFLSLTFFGRMLMFFSDVLDEWSDAFSGTIRSALGAGRYDDDDE